MRARWKVLVALVGAIAIAGIVPALGSTAPSRSQPGTASFPKVLEIYAGSPVLVRAGEDVRLPVHVVCATAAGEPCRASVTLATRASGEARWQATTTPAAPALTFDLTASTVRAAASGADSVDFFVRAQGPGGKVVGQPPSGSDAPQRYFVAADIPVIHAPTIPFGHVRTGATALFLPWGSGSGRAGLQPGRESATLGPSSFDVDAEGRIYLADALQDRVAEFRNGRLVRQIRVPMSARADLAVTAGGAVFVLDGRASEILVRRFDASGTGASVLSLGAALLGQIRTHGEAAVVHLQPSGMWVDVSHRGDSLATSSTNPGRQVAGGQLIRAIDQDHLRLGTVRRGRVADAVEVRFGQSLGELALAEPDGSGGYWAVVHVWREGPTPVDQYVAVHIVRAKIVEAFAVGDARFADTPPLARFRMGADGSLYQLITRSDGVRIVRYALGGES